MSFAAAKAIDIEVWLPDKLNAMKSLLFPIAPIHAAAL